MYPRQGHQPPTSTRGQPATQANLPSLQRFQSGPCRSRNLELMRIFSTRVSPAGAPAGAPCRPTHVADPHPLTAWPHSPSRIFWHKSDDPVTRTGAQRSSSATSTPRNSTGRGQIASVSGRPQDVTGPQTATNNNRQHPPTTTNPQVTPVRRTDRAGHK